MNQFPLPGRNTARLGKTSPLKSVARGRWRTAPASDEPMWQKICAAVAGSVSVITQKRTSPVCWRPSRNRTSTDAPLASGVADVTVKTDIVLLKPPPFGWLGGCSSVVPCTVTLLVPLLQGGRSTVSATAFDVRGRRSATPEMALNVVMSMTRKRRRVMLLPELLV